MCIPHCIPCLLQLCVISSFQLPIQLSLIATVIHPEVKNFLGSLGVCEFNGGSRVKFNVVCLPDLAGVGLVAQGALQAHLFRRRTSRHQH